MRSFLACLLLTGFAYGQAASPNATFDNHPLKQEAPFQKESPIASSSESADESSVKPDDPVITLNGLCSNAATKVDFCATVITRAQFETVTEALQPGMRPALRLKVANSYARNLRMSAEAEKRGMDKSSAFQEEMRYARMQLLSQDLSRTLQAEANNISATDLKNYYKDHASAYEEATLARIFVPRSKQSGTTQDTHQGARAAEGQSDVNQAAMTQVAATLRVRALRGEDFDKLQVEAYSEAGIPRTLPNTKMEKVRRSSLPPQHERVMDLKAGEVSEVFSDPEGGHFIYKMLSLRTLELEEVEGEIRHSISSQRYGESMREFEGSTVFSDAYFNPPTEATPASRNHVRKKIKAAE